MRLFTFVCESLFRFVCVSVSGFVCKDCLGLQRCVGVGERCVKVRRKNRVECECR